MNHDETSDVHLFFNKEKFDKSVETAFRWEHEVENVPFDTQTNTCEIYIDILEGGVFDNFFREYLPDGSLTFATHEYMTFSSEDISENYDNDYVFVNLEDTQEVSFDANVGKKVVSTEAYDEFKTFLVNSIKNLNDANEVNDFIINELNVEFEEELKNTVTESREHSIIACFIAKHKWVPRAGIASPIPGDNQTFSSIQKMLGVVRRYYKFQNKRQPDRNSLYYFPLVGEGSWLIKIEGEDKPRIDNPPFICCFHDCDYHCSVEKQRFEHQKNGTHINAVQRAPDVGPFWMSLIDFANKHNELPTIDTILNPRETIVCEECGAYFADINAISQHLFKKHKITNTRITGQHILHGQLIWVSREEEEQLLQEANRQKIIAFARPIVEASNQEHQEE